MQKIFFTVGPSKLYPTIPKHLAKAVDEDILSISHRGEVFQAIFKNTIASLKELCGIPAEHHVFFLTSGSEGMERSLQNCVESESFHFVDGAFGEKFHATALGLKKSAALQKARNPVDFTIAIPPTTEAICFTQNETSTGFQVPPETVYTVAKKNPEKLIFIDVVSSIPYTNLDYSVIDCAFFSVQKGFGLPAGLGVIVVSPRAIARALALEKKGVNVSWYHSFGQLLKYAEKNQTNETPNVLAIYLLGKVIEDMQKIGLANIRKHLDAHAEKLYQLFETDERFTLPPGDAGARSKTTLVAGVVGGSAGIIAELKGKGLVVGAGYGKQKDAEIRIANFPAHTDDDFTALLSALS